MLNGNNVPEVSSKMLKRDGISQKYQILYEHHPCLALSSSSLSLSLLLSLVLPAHLHNVEFKLMNLV